jgi:hypothetical protein
MLIDEALDDETDILGVAPKDIVTLEVKVFRINFTLRPVTLWDLKEEQAKLNALACCRSQN